MGINFLNCEKFRTYFAFVNPLNAKILTFLSPPPDAPKNAGGGCAGGPGEYVVEKIIFPPGDLCHYLGFVFTR